MNRHRTIHRKQLNKITTVDFHDDDLSIIQEDTLVILDKDEVLELARIILNEQHDRAYFEKKLSSMRESNEELYRLMGMELKQKGEEK